jgi:hypothetical protein
MDQFIFHHLIYLFDTCVGIGSMQIRNRPHNQGLTMSKMPPTATSGKLAHAGKCKHAHQVLKKRAAAVQLQGVDIFDWQEFHACCGGKVVMGRTTRRSWQLRGGAAAAAAQRRWQLGGSAAAVAARWWRSAHRRLFGSSVAAAAARWQCSARRRRQLGGGAAAAATVRRLQLGCGAVTVAAVVALSTMAAAAWRWCSGSDGSAVASLTGTPAN